MMAIGLQQAEENGTTVVNRHVIGFDYMFKTHGFADAKAMVAALMLEHYPQTCSGRIMYEAVHLKRHQHVVMKPSSGAMGMLISIFVAEGLERATKIAEFEEIYQQYLANFKDPINIIVQPYIEGIHENGEVRVFVYGGKYLLG